MTTTKAHIPIGIPPGMRMLRIERDPGTYIWRKPDDQGSWRIWLHTNDYIHGTYLTLHDNGKIERTTERRDRGPETDLIKPEDD